MQFAIFEHSDGSHHFELRLERSGILKCWVLPRGLPARRGTKRLAIQIADSLFGNGHPAGGFGAEPAESTAITAWDEGAYKIRSWRKRSIVFTLHGRRCDGTHAFVKFDRAGPAAWLLLRTRTRYAERNPIGSE